MLLFLGLFLKGPLAAPFELGFGLLFRRLSQGFDDWFVTYRSKPFSNSKCLCGILKEHQLAVDEVGPHLLHMRFSVAFQLDTDLWASYSHQVRLVLALVVEVVGLVTQGFVEQLNLWEHGILFLIQHFCFFQPLLPFYKHLFLSKAFLFAVT